MIGLLLALALVQPAADHAHAERLFMLGRRLVAEGDTAGAVAAWEGATATGWTSATVEHNLGTVALNRGDVPRARLHLERALRLAPLDGAIAHNLRLAREQAGEPPLGPARQAWDRAVGVLTPLGVVALALAAAFGALGLAVAGRRRGAAVVGVAALAAVAAAGLAVGEATRPLAIVLSDDAPVVEAPSPTAPGVARLRAGEAVEVGEAVDGWRPVTVGRARGWVRADAVGAI